MEKQLSDDLVIPPTLGWAQSGDSRIGNKRKRMLSHKSSQIQQSLLYKFIEFVFKSPSGIDGT